VIIKNIDQKRNWKKYYLCRSRKYSGR